MLMLSLAGASTSHSSSGDRPATPTTGTSVTTHSRCGGLSLATLTTTMERGAPMLSQQLKLMLSLAGASTSHSSSGDYPATPTGTSNTTHSRCGGLSLATLTTTMARGAPMLSPQLKMMLSLAGASTSHSSNGDHPATPTTGAGLRDITSMDITKTDTSTEIMFLAVFWNGSYQHPVFLIGLPKSLK